MSRLRVMRGKSLPTPSLAVAEPPRSRIHHPFHAEKVKFCSKLEHGRLQHLRVRTERTRGLDGRRPTPIEKSKPPVEGGRGKEIEQKSSALMIDATTPLQGTPHSPIVQADSRPRQTYAFKSGQATAAKPGSTCNAIVKHAINNTIQVCSWDSHLLLCYRVSVERAKSNGWGAPRLDGEPTSHQGKATP